MSTSLLFKTLQIVTYNNNGWVSISQPTFFTIENGERI